MTTIIAVETPTGVIIGADSQSTSYRKETLSEGKIFSNGEYTIAVAGRARLVQELKYMELPKPAEGNLDRFMNTEFLAAIKKAAKNSGINDGENEVIVAVRGKVFKYDADLTVSKSASRIYTSGSGSPWAEGVLAGLKRVTVRDVRRALESAAQNDIYTSGPFVVKKLTS